MTTTNFSAGTVVASSWLNDVDDTVYNKVSNCVNVKSYGAVGDGTTDDTAALENAITAVSNLGGGFVDLDAGTFRITNAQTIPTKVILRGKGKGTTTIKRGFTGDFITSCASFAGLRDLTIDGDTATVGAGKGVLIPTGNPGQLFFNAEIKNFVSPCLEFAADGGSGFRSISCDYYTTGTPGSVAAIKINGTDTQAIPRHFISTEGGGCTLYDFGGCNDLFVFGGYSSGLIFGAAASKVMLNAVRIGSAAGTVTIKGSSHKIKGCIFASSVILDTGTTGIDFDCEVPSWDITDNGSSNYVTIGGAIEYTPTLTSTGTAPALGNGTLTGFYTRKGNMIEGFIDFSTGTTTTLGTGNWLFSLPRVDYSFFVQAGGGGFTQTTGAGQDYQLITRVSPGTGKLELFSVDITGTLRQLGGTTKAWASGSTFRFSFCYVTT